MLSINTDKSGHVGPPGSGPIPEEYLQTLRHALQLIQSRIVGHYQSDKVFKALPGKKSFQTMFNDMSTWVNYDPDNHGHLWGWTLPVRYHHDVVVSKFALRMGFWSTAGTIVHELAHLDGASGKRTSDAAERTLKFSGLASPKGPYDPLVRG